MKLEKREHVLYKEWVKVKKLYKDIELTQLVDRWQFIYSSDKGKISLVKLLNYFNDGQDFWEIYCLEGDLFENTERFYTKAEAVKRIKEILENEKVRRGKKT